MTEEQKKYYNAMKKLGSKKPQKPIPRPLVSQALSGGSGEDLLVVGSLGGPHSTEPALRASPLSPVREGGTSDHAQGS